MKISHPKILLLAPPNSIHTIKWANELVKKGFNIYLFGFDASKNEKYHNLVRHETFSVPNWIISRGFGSIIKIYYLLSIPKIYKILKKIQPDIIHSHYASSYGILGAFTRFHPNVVSVWGSDVFSFPDQSFLHKIVLKFVLNRADYILSTSQFMMQRTKEFTSKEIRVTPFGVDLDIFCKNKKNQCDEIVIGTTKGLEKQYGIEFLIKAFARLVNKYSDNKLKLLIIGDGSLRKEMEKLTADLKISSFVNFTGFVSNEKIPEYLNTIDIYVAVSIYDDESFGVAIVEA
ncbi:MAG TPA: glycosyltransferase, partial [Ignavibacteriaceae bacterium]|nr:glycosyltransferase [Ignavibacteriaceae bacterium]